MSGSPGTAAPRPRLLFFVTEDWYFCSHRLPIARSARDAGFEVIVVTRVDRHRDAMESEGFRVIPVGLRRSSVDPLRELAVLAALVRIYRRERPDIVHHVAMKPVLYGSVAAFLTGVPAVVNALAGLGFAFTSRRRRARLLRPLLRLGFRLLLNRARSRVIVQNPDDAAVLANQCGIDEARIALIRGSGVDVTQFAPSPEAPGVPVAAFVSRMLWEKGVDVVVEAARRLAARGTSVRVLLAGVPDPENPGSIPEDRLRRWHEEGAVEWCGHRNDIAALWAESHLAVLPTHGEGLPKSLLEAAACGRPIVATDVPGCREIVRDGETGLLVPPHDAVALADAIDRLVGDHALRRRLGARAREVAVAEFSEERVVAATLALYRSMLPGQAMPAVQRP